MAMAPETFCPPSRIQLALALAVVKSKPSNTTVKEHLTELRNHIRAGRREQAPATEDKHIDSSAFWRQAYENSEAAQSKLLDRIYELEQRNESLLLAKSQDSQAAPSEATCTKRKSRSDEQRKSSLGPSQKRNKTLNKKGSGAAKTNSNAAKGLESFGGPEDPTASLMRNSFALRKLLQKKIDPGSLTSHSVELCKAAGKSLDSARCNPGTRPVHNPESVVSGVERCYPCLLQCLKKLSSSPRSGTNDAGTVIYHAVQLFRTTLEIFHRYSLSKAKNVRGVRKRAGTKTKPLKTAAPNGVHPVPKETDKVLSAFSRLLTVMILSLEPTKEEQKNLLEGYLFVLLEYIGQTLGLFVFRDLHTNPGLRVDKTKLPLPASLAAKPIGSTEFADCELAAEWESKYLIWVADRAMGSLNRHNLATQDGPDATGKATTAPFPPSHLLDLTRSRLQNTLLAGVFGTDEPEFSDSLKPLQAPPGPEVNIPSPAQGLNVGEWFTQELWRLLGWDILQHVDA